MFLKKKAIIAVFCFIRIALINSAMVEMEPDPRDKVKAYIQYSIINFSEIICHSRIEVTPTIIIKKAKGYVKKLVKIKGWLSTVRDIQNEFNQIYNHNILIVPNNIEIGIMLKIMLIYSFYALKHLDKLITIIKIRFDMEEEELYNKLERQLILEAQNLIFPGLTMPVNPEYYELDEEVIVKKTVLAKELLNEAIARSTNQTLVKAIENNYPAIVKLILKQGIIPSKNDLMLAKLLYDSEDNEKVQESFGRIIKIIYNYLMLLTSFGGISKKGIIDMREEISPEIAHHIAQFLD